MSVVSEVISGGPPDHPGANTSARLVVGALALAVLVTGGTWMALQQDRTAPVHRGTPGSTAAPPSPLLEVPARPLRPTLTGVSAGGPSGLRLLVGGGSLSVVEAVTGARSTVGVSVPPGGAVTQLLSVAGGILVVVQQDQPGGDSGPGSVHLLRPGRGPVEVLAADEVVASARPGRFWAFVYPRRQGSKATFIEATTGGQLLSTRPVPAGWQLLADTGDGLLVAAYRQEGPGELMTVDPVSLRVRRVLEPITYVAAATPRMAAWTGLGCTDTCDLVVGDLRDGRRRTFRLAMHAGISAVFSPDERQLAIAYFGQHGDERTRRPGFVEVLDLVTGRRTRVPGVATPEKQAAEVCWSRDGRWLGIAVRWPEEGYQRVGIWPVAGGRVVELPVPLPARYSSALLAVTRGDAGT